MTTLEQKTIGDRTHYVLDGRTLANGDALELRMRGNRGWTDVHVDGLPSLLRVRWVADNGQELHASVDASVELRWP
ncbi:MAG: hypothetical protein AAF721_24875 [Myxococcota bacterium]